MGGGTSVADAISRTGACLGLAFEGGEDVPRQKLPRYHLMLAIMLQMFYQYHLTGKILLETFGILFFILILEITF